MLSSQLLQDARFAVRQFRKSPAFALVAVATLALGIGATTAIFSVVNGMLLRPLPYPNSDRIVQLWEVQRLGSHVQVSDPNFRDLRDQTRSFSVMAQVSDMGTVSVSGGGAAEPTRSLAAAVSRDFFRVLGVTPVEGRLFVAEETKENGVPAVVVSAGFARRYSGSVTAALGTRLTVGGRVYTVVGVVPEALDVPAGAELWTPRELEPAFESRTAQNSTVLALLAPGVTPAQGRADASAVAKRLKRRYGEQTAMLDVSLVPLREELVGQTRPALEVLLAASLVLLLIACANVVNLLVARMASRRTELALRLALGAGRARLTRQLLTETLALSLGGGVVGVALAAAGVRALPSLRPANLPRAAEVGIDWRVLVFAFAVSVAVAVALGLAAAWRSSAGNLRDRLAEAQRSSEGGVGGAGSQRLRSVLVTAQMAMTLMLLVGAGLLGRSFLRLVSVDPGFRTSQRVVLDVSDAQTGNPLSGGIGPAMAQRVAFYDELLRRLSALPGVSAVGGVNEMPLSLEGGADGTFLILSSPDVKFSTTDWRRFEEMMRDPAHTGHADYRVASEGYFRAMGIPLEKGRLFDARDGGGAGAAQVALISSALAKARWPNEDPLGKVLEFGNMDGDVTPLTIVGVVGDVREASLAATPRSVVYVDYRQRPVGAGRFNVVLADRTADPTPVITAARRVVHDLRPEIPPRIRTIETLVSRSLTDRRFVLVLVGVFGAAALLLATLGVYSVISYLVILRERELSIRVALGAQRGDVVWLVLGRGVVLAGAGIVIGVLASFGATRLLAGLLYGVSATDPMSFGVVVAVLAGVAVAASWLPARRAARAEPASVLRG